jgi:glutamyl-tRNA synthetase
MARRAGGTFVLRIENTDLERSVPEFESRLLADLRWLGLDWDEGPDVGGSHQPYRQTDRTELYQRQAQRLIEAGAAYPCFCTADQLQARRDARATSGEELHYDGTCRRLDPETARARVEAGEPHTVRFSRGHGAVEFDDVVRGAIRIDRETFGDFVLLRSNGLPTYNFACVVDDADMQISHVLRGEDHLYNTVRQLLLYEALGIPPPLFAHLPLILDEDRSKLRKREGRTGTFVDEYRSGGYVPEALMNFLALLGWSAPDGEEVLTPAALVATFDVARVSRSAAVFDARKMEWMAGEHLRALDEEELVRRAEPFLRQAGLEFTAAEARHWVAAFRSHVSALGQLPGRVRALLDEPLPDAAAHETLRTPEARRLLEAVAEALERVGHDTQELDGSGFKALLQRCGRELGVKGRALFMPVRVAMTGQQHGPELPLLFDVLGLERTRRRLRDGAA